MPIEIKVAIGLAIVVFGAAIVYPWIGTRPTRRIARGRIKGPQYASLNELGYKVRASKPNKDGKCKFKIVCIATGEVVAETDTPGTLDEIMPNAIKFVNKNLTK